MDNPGGGGTTAVVQFDLNGPEAERVVTKIIRRTGSGYGIKLSLADSKILTEVLYAQATVVQVLQGKVRQLQEQLYPLKMVQGTLPAVVEQGSKRWWKPSR